MTTIRGLSHFPHERPFFRLMAKHSTTSSTSRKLLPYEHLQSQPGNEQGKSNRQRNKNKNENKKNMKNFQSQTKLVAEKSANQSNAKDSPRHPKICQLHHLHLRKPSNVFPTI